MDTDHEASSAWTDLARWLKKDPEIEPIVRLQTEYERLVGVKWLWNWWDELEVGVRTQWIAGSSLIAVTRSTYSVISAPEVCRYCAL